MATPTDGFTPEMLKKMVEMVNEYREPQSLFVSRGWRDALAAKVPVLKPSVTQAPNPLMAGYTLSYASIPYDVVDIPPEEVIDWSGCRSPARAKRRHARGIPQRIKITYRERAYLVDRKAMADMMRVRFERMAYGEIMGKGATAWDGR